MFMLKKKITLALVTFASIIGLPMACWAGAAGYEYWGGTSGSIKGISVPIPAGQLFHQIWGKGHHIGDQAANFASVGNICDSSMRFTYGYGEVYVSGNIHEGCSHVGQWKYAMNMDVPGGDACAELWAKNWRILVARQCHYVY